MAIKKVIEIDVDVVKAAGGLDNFTKNFKETETAAKSLKAQLREAQQEVAQLSEKFGATSREAVEAAKKAALLKDRIGDAKTLTDAFNPDAKFKALSGALTGVAGGFSVVTGAMGTLGAESESTQEAILKVQSAMAIASGAQAVGESVDQFRQLGAVVKSYSIVQKVVTAAQWLFNAAMAANPIGAIVAAVAALIAAGYALIKMFQASSAAAEASAKSNAKLSNEIKNLKEQTEKSNIESELSRDTQLRMAKASGQSADAIRKLSEQLAMQEVIEKRLNAVKAQSLFLEARRKSEADKDNEALQETTKAAKKAFDEQNKIYNDALLERRKLIISNRVEEVQERTNANKKAKEDAEKLSTEQIAEKKKTDEELRKAEEDRIKSIAKLEEDYIKELQNINAKSDQEKLDLQKKRELEEINSLTKTAQEKESLLRLFDEKYITLQQELDAKNAEATRVKLEEETALRIEKEDAEWLRYQELTLSKADYDKLLLTQKYEEEYLAAEGNAALQKELQEKLATDINAIDQKTAEQKKILRQQEIQAAGQTFGILADLMGKQSKAGKAFAVAQALINTYQGITAGLKLGYPMAIPAVALAAVTGFAAVKNILKTDPKSGTGGSTSAPSGGGGGETQAPPQFNLVGQSSTNQLASTIAGQQNKPMQTYVVGNQVTTQQSLDRNAVQTSTFG